MSNPVYSRIVPKSQQLSRNKPATGKVSGARGSRVSDTGQFDPLHDNGGHPGAFEPQYPADNGGKSRGFDPLHSADNGGKSRGFDPLHPADYGGKSRVFDPLHSADNGGNPRAFDPHYAGDSGGKSRGFAPLHPADNGGNPRAFEPHYPGDSGGKSKGFDPLHPAVEGSNSRAFDPLNHNNGGKFHAAGQPAERGERRRREERARRGAGARAEPAEGKVEAYLRQNQVSLRQQRHSAVRQAEHRVNLRSLPLGEGQPARAHERTPSERDGERREHRRERDRDSYHVEGASRNPLSPVVISRINQHAEAVRVRKSSSAQRLEQPTFGGVTRRFHCREWAFQKLAHCLEQRPVSKTCGALVLGDSGSGKTALCRELTRPGGGPAARQQRALNRRLLAAIFLQDDEQSGLRTAQFVRSLAARLLSHSSERRARSGRASPPPERPAGAAARRRASEEEVRRLRGRGEAADDGEDSSKPLLADSEDQRTDEEEPALMRDAPLSGANELPEVLPRTCNPSTNPFLNSDEKKDSDMKIYENHENVFLRNISQRQSKELRNSRLLRQSSEPLTDKKANILQKSYSTEPKTDSASSENETRDIRKIKEESGSPTNAKISRIPVANFRYPNKSGLGSSSNENSPLKAKPNSTSSLETKEKDVKQEEFDVKDEEGDSKEDNVIAVESLKEELEKLEVKLDEDDELPEYQNILKPRNLNFESEDPQKPDFEKLRSQNEDAPPPIPSLPVSPRTLIANAYYEKLLSDPEIQESLLPHNLEKNPDECFKKAILFPLLEIDPPKQCLFLLVDSLDEGTLNGSAASKDGDGKAVSRTVAELLANHHHLFPQWLLLVCTARKQSKSLTKMFTGFRKIALDDLQRAHVSADVQRYVLARLDGEPRLRARVSSDAAAAAAAAAALDHLRIKSDGCLLYLEKVLDGIADGFIALREIREIPGTLNGLYLWLAQRIFHGRRFAKVRLMLEVLLAARCGVTEEMLYKCLLTDNYSLTRDDFNRRLHLLRRILVVEQSTGFLSVFHHSFGSWLVDVKHCTRRYLCSPALGHAALAMYYTLEANRLSPLEIQHYVLHMTRLEQHLTALKKNKDRCEDPLDLHTLTLLWVIDSGCRVETSLRSEPALASVMQDIPEEDNSPTDNLDATKALPEAADWRACDAGGAGGAGLWAAARDARVLRSLLELGARPAGGAAAAAAEAGAGQPAATAPQESPTETEPPPPDAAPAGDRTLPHRLVQRGDDEALRKLLEKHPELAEAQDAAGGTALHAAARHGRGACAAALLAAGARADLADADGCSPLRAAAWAGHTEVVEVLLQYGCEVDCVDADNRTALRAAAWSGHEAVVALLLAAGAAADRADGEGRTPLIAAAYMGHAEIVAALLAAGADVRRADEDGRTALSVACLCASGAQCAAILLEKGADVTKADRDNATPLLVAAFEGHTEICELLLEYDADPEACDAAGRTALWAAASAGHAPTVRLLLFWGACVDGMDREGRTVLSVAAAQGNVEVVRQLLDRGLDEHHRDNAGWTPLHYAVFEGHTEVCEALLEAGAKVDEADNDGKGALMLAAQEGHTRLIEILIDDWGAPVDQHAHDGKTALRLAALEGHLEAVGALRERGADPDALDADRRSTLYVLALDDRLAAARYLVRQCGAAVDIGDTEGRTPLHVAAWQGHTDMVNMLIKLGGAEVDGRDRCQRTALHAAAWRGRAAALRALLQHGADPAAVCTQGATPLGIAAQEGHEECVVWLLQHGADPQQADHCGRTPAAVAWRAGQAGVCRLLERWAATAHAPPAADTDTCVLSVLPGRTPAAVAWRAGHAGVCRLLERWAAAAHAPPAADTDTSGSTAETRACTAALLCPVAPQRQGSPQLKRRSVHSSNSTKSSTNTTGGSGVSGDVAAPPPPAAAAAAADTSDARPELTFAQQVARCGRGCRERRGGERDASPERTGERDARLRSYAVNERDTELRGYVRARGGRRERDGDTSPLYASPPRSPAGDVCSPTRPPRAPPSPAGAAPVGGGGGGASATDQHFARDTHMRIILGRDAERAAPAAAALPRDRRAGAYGRLMGSLRRVAGRRITKQQPAGKSKRNGIATNPAMRLVANVRNGLDHAAANIRRTGVALAASAGSSNPAVKTNAFQWRRETPL